MSYRTYEEYLRHPKFLAVRKQVMERAEGICENDLATGAMHHKYGLERCRNRATEVHHLKYCRWGEFDVPENLIAVCHECHEDLHTCPTCGGYLKARDIKAGRETCFECFLERN